MERASDARGCPLPGLARGAGLSARRRRRSSGRKAFRPLPTPGVHRLIFAVSVARSVPFCSVALRAKGVSSRGLASPSQLIACRTQVSLGLWAAALAFRYPEVRGTRSPMQGARNA